MSLDSINNCILSKRFWIVSTVILLSIFFYPLLSGHFYVPVYDNLDSNVVWYKILAESGKIFAPNNAIIPNMMNGLPRASYGSEFDLLLWLYYFFTPKIAYIINEVLIHLIAFFSMFLFLKKHVISEHKRYKYVLIFVGSLYFTLLPFWSGSGASLALLPLITYVLLNIKHGSASLLDWILLVLIPFYSSFILIVIFYLALAGIYFIYDTVKTKAFNKSLFSALLLVTTLYILKNYRLIQALFFDNSFISHRTEFDVFYNSSLWETYTATLFNFLNGHTQHAPVLAQYVLPIIIIGMLLSLFRRKLSSQESLIIWLLIIVSFVGEIWNTLLIHRYTLPILILFSLYLLWHNNKDKALPLLMLLMILITVLGTLPMYEGLKGITQVFPLLKSINIRIYFLLPFLYAIALTYSFKEYFRTLYATPVFIVLFMLVQFNYSLNVSFFNTHRRSDFESFESYYATKLFQQIKSDMQKNNLPKGRFVSYGIEPAVALYNDLYTIDGYSVNYPLSYKHKFRKVQEEECFNFMKANKNIYDNWGSKVYLLCMDARPYIHRAFKESNHKTFPLYASPQKLCELNAKYILSGVELSHIDKNEVHLLQHYHDTDKGLWEIWLYQLHCSSHEKDHKDDIK